MRRLGFHVGRFGVYAFARHHNFTTWWLIPTLTIDYLNVADERIDIEIDFLRFSVGLRFIWLKNKRN